jgi:hypothetical protein
MSAASTSQPARPVSAGLVIGGYVAALLFPIVGVILGVIASRRYSGVGTNHAPGIFAVAAISFLLGLVILAGGSA